MFSWWCHVIALSFSPSFCPNFLSLSFFPFCFFSSFLFSSFPSCSKWKKGGNESGKREKLCGKGRKKKERKCERKRKKDRKTGHFGPFFLPFLSLSSSFSLSLIWFPSHSILSTSVFHEWMNSRCNEWTLTNNEPSHSLSLSFTFFSHYFIPFFLYLIHFLVCSVFLSGYSTLPVLSFFSICTKNERKE